MMLEQKNQYTKSKMNSGPAPVPASGVILLIALVLVSFPASLSAQPMGRATEVAVIAARQQQVAKSVTLVGSVEPFTRSLMASEVAGLVEKLEIEEGDLVQKNQIICRLRDTVARLAVEEAKAEQKRLEQQLAELEAGSRPETIKQTKARMEEAEALWQNWKNELERVKRLYQANQASQQEYNDAVAEHSAAKQRYIAAKLVHELAVDGPRKEEIARARHAVEAQKARVDQLRYNLEQTRIKAPFTGFVTVKHTEVGEWINPGGSVAELIDLDHVLVQVDVPEAAVSGLQRDDEVSVDIDALDKTFRGEVAHIIPQADEKARTFPVEIKLQNKQRRLKSGMFARARLSVGQPTESVVVPRDAIIQRRGAHYVVIITPSPDKKSKFGVPVPVMLGTQIGSWIAVQSPSIQPGMPVAVKGHERVYGPVPVQTTPANWIKPPPTAGPTTRPADTTASRAPEKEKIGKKPQTAEN